MPVCLHTHSWYSLLEGVSSPEALLHRAATCGYSALALTDTNNLYGAVPFVDVAKRFGTPDEFGAACAFLCSAQAGYITGQNILIDGGAFPGAM